MSELDNTENLSNAQVPEAPTPPAAPPADSAPAPTEAPNGEAQAEPEAEKTPAWFVKETSKLRRQRAESERRADRLAAEIEALKKAPQQQQPKSNELRPEDFPNYDAFIGAKIAAGVREGIGAAEQHRSQTEVEKAVLRQREVFIEKASAQAEEAGIDLEDVMDTLRRQPLVSEDVVQYLAGSEEAARLAEYLAEHPDELRRISQLGPALAKKSLAKAEASIGAKAKPNATNAPPPPPKVGGRSVNQTDWRKTENMEDYGSNWQKDREARLKD